MPRSRSKTPAIVLAVVAVAALAAGGVWYFTARGRSPAPEAPPTATQPAAPTTRPAAPATQPVTTHPAAIPPPATAPDAAGDSTARPDPNTPTATQPATGTTAPAATAPTTTTTAPATRPADAVSGSAALESARKLHASGKLLEARTQLNEFLKTRPVEADAADARALLERIADETIFSRRTVKDDPLVEAYAVQPGDGLERIGRKYDVPYELLMTINGITRPNSLRADQTIKVLKGPFHARISKSQFRMDVYLGDVFVRSYPVGLGTESGTPEGKWQVKNRLLNPTYYPPATAPGEKRIIEPDDPNNPLGEHWLGLEGIEGEAVGRTGFGVHGTIDPNSIGKAESLGCVRMHNEHVAVVYQMLAPGKSTVTIEP